MSSKVYIRTAIYLLLIWVGYLFGEYPAIPSFKIMGFHHQQPNIDIYDKGIAFMLLTWSIVFITWGMIGNLFDELLDRTAMFSSGEQIALVMALLTTSILMYKKWKKK